MNLPHREVAETSPQWRLKNLSDAGRRRMEDARYRPRIGGLVQGVGMIQLFFYRLFVCLFIYFNDSVLFSR